MSDLSLFNSFGPWIYWILLLGGILFFGYFFAPLIFWTLFALIFLFLCEASLPTFIGFLAVALVLNVKPLRSFFISSFLMKILKALRFIPSISATEKAALKAGIVWVEGDLFSGRPKLKRLFNQKFPDLSKEEQAFLDGPTEEICQKINDWKIWKKREIPEPVFKFIKEKGFLGMIIPKEYGGLEFSARAHSEILMKISTQSLALGITVMVPNSLGPAELLIHYGTDEQKKKYLPRLACGKEIPCFALTEPTAGSDAGSITAEGILFRDEKSGRISIRLNWNKRWITLAAISTVLGLAFRLRDPDHLIGEEENVGITCALIPSHTKGVVLGRRHDPLGLPFYNCPTQGQDVVVDAEECIIGGLKGSGKGWSMLMESLAAGRGISLPALSVGGTHLIARLVSSYSVVRKQFGVSIKKFEGVEEPLARIGGACYFMEALRLYTLSALDQNIKPPVVTAIAKYNATEIFRKRINDAMDILGGSGISMGPRNQIALPYMSAPISITVEGANILTRTLIIFGQGLFRAHPHVFDEIEAIEKNDARAFDKAFWSHVHHVIGNFIRTLFLTLTRGFFVIPYFSGRVGRYTQKLIWVSSSFALLADVAMLLFGGKLKLKEKITGRFADILSWMYIGTAVLRRYKAEGSLKDDLPFVDYSMQLAFHKIQEAFEGLFANFDHPLLSWFFKGPLLLFANLNKLGRSPSDQLTHKIVNLITTPGPQRERLIKSFVSSSSHKGSDFKDGNFGNEALLKLEKTFKLVKESEPIERKLRSSIRKKELPKKPLIHVLDEALSQNILNQKEYEVMKNVEKLSLECIQVDDFSEEEYG